MRAATVTKVIRLIFVVQLAGALLALGGCGGGGDGGGGIESRGVSITAFSPTSGTPGTAVTISGAGFGATAASNTVRFNDVQAQVTAASTTVLTATVPATATSGLISVTASNDVGYSTTAFTVLAPASNPPAAPTGVTVTPGSTQNTISWSAVSGANSYNIYWLTTTGVNKLNGNRITNATSPYVHTGLTNGTAYFYVVTAVNSAGESVESTQANATPVLAIPAAPTGVAALAANAQNTISWNAVSGATSYNLYWSTTSGVTKATGTKIPGVTSPFVHSTLTNGTTYFYVVTAANGAGESADSAQVSATPTAPVAVPAAPSGVSAVAGNAQNTISWGAVSGATSYNLYWSTTSGVTKATGTKIPGVANPFVHSTLTNDTTYYYVVTAVNANGESADSTQASAIPALASNTWTTAASLPSGQSGSASGVISGILYIAGGNPPTGFATTVVRAYDPASNVWTTKASAPTSRTYVGGGVINGKLYVVGGCVDSDCRIGTTNVLGIYDPVANSWTSGAPMPTARWGVATGVINGKLYVAGGSIACPPCSFQTTLEVYDPVANTWSSTAQPLLLGRQMPGGAVVNGILYVFGGINGTTFLNSVEAYDPVTNSWTPKAAMPTGRYGSGVEAINGIVYVAGGGASAGAISVLEAYDPLANSWLTKPSMPTGRYLMGTGVLNSRLYTVGGTNASGTVVSTVEVYVP